MSRCYLQIQNTLGTFRGAVETHTPEEIDEARESLKEAMSADAIGPINILDDMGNTHCFPAEIASRSVVSFMVLND